MKPKGSESSAVVEERPIPTFPDFRKLELRDRTIIQELLQETPVGVSDFAFANLFAWSEGFPIEVSRLGNHLLLLERPAKGVPHFLPILGPGTIESTAEAIAEFLPRIFHIPEALLGGYEIFQQRGFHVQFDRDNSDYVYRRQDLATLKGRTYDGIRQHVRKFQEVASGYRFRPLGPELFESCLSLHRDWTSIRARGIDPEIYAYEYRAVQKAFEHFQVLKLLGGVLEISGRVEAFALCEPLDSETVVVLHEKANPEFPGIFQALNQECAQQLFANFPFVNYEQDLGSPGLRRAKLSYHPAFMVNKYILERKA